MIVGGSAVKAILGQKVAPGLLDRYLAQSGYESQQRPELDVPGRANNLLEPLPGDRGADGPFTGESRSSSIQLWLRGHPMTRMATSAVVALAFAGIAVAARRRRAG